MKTGNVYDFFQNHARAIGRAVLSLLLIIGSAVLCSYVPDVDFFVTFVSAVLIVIFVTKLLFIQIKNTDFWWISVLLCIMMAANQLYSFEKLSSIFPVLKRINIGLAFVIGIGLWFITAVIVKLYALADKQEPPDQLQVSNPAHHPTSAGANTDTNTLNNGQKNYVTVLRGSQGKSSKIFIAIVAFLFFVIGATGFIFQKIYQDSSQTENVNYPDVLFVYALYGLTILGIMIVIIIAISILITAIPILIAVIRLLVTAIRNIAKREDNIADVIPTYTLSALITLVLFYFVYVRNDFELNDFTSIATKGDYLAIPLTFILMLVSFCVIIWVIHYVLLLLIAMSTQKYGHHFIKRFSVDAKKIVITIYSIVFDTINVALAFVKFIPHYFRALVRFVIGDDEEELDDTDNESVFQKEKHGKDESDTIPVILATESTEVVETNEEGEV